MSVSCLALQIYTALVSIFFTWLFLRPRRARSRASGQARKRVARDSRASVTDAVSPAEPEPFLDPQTIADWSATLAGDAPFVTQTGLTARVSVPTDDGSRSAATGDVTGPPRKRPSGDQRSPSVAKPGASRTGKARRARARRARASVHAVHAAANPR
ncbi:MAG: hypothetical protein R3E87_14290 [Burkholderiaceae bacterium]